MRGYGSLNSMCIVTYQHNFVKYFKKGILLCLLKLISILFGAITTLISKIGLRISKKISNTVELISLLGLERCLSRR
uniref:Uncharacterized protein n=1 Tax=Bacteriophage sp. TaxID=38018 RepID=A0A8D9UHQ9_9VIRU|nr:MAG TPA: hypothetical protein [Bacteriophage sp.]